MATRTIARPVRPNAGKIPVRQITDEDLRIALRQGLDDFLDLRGDLFFAGLIYTLIGLLAVAMTSNMSLLPLFLPVVAGVGLLGPITALGFYELARQREGGDEVHWFNFFDVRKRPTVDDMGMVAGLLLMIFFAWLIAAGVLYVMLFGWNAPVSVPDFLGQVFTTPHGWALIAIGGAVGVIFGWSVLALSVVSLPMLVDRNVSASEAVSTSWRAAHANRGEMLRWGIVVTVLLALGSIPLFVGLAFVLPWLGYSTWHLYTRLIDRDALKTRGNG